MYTIAMGISTDQFIQKYNNKICTHPQGIIGQCVCLYRCYLDEVLGVPQSPSVTGARLIWNTYLPQYFDRIPYTFFGSRPQKGDIVIFNSFPGNVYGHVGIADKPGGVFSFTSFDSNWSVPKHAKIETHSYRYVIGWLRRKTYAVVTDEKIKGMFRTTWKLEPAYGDWFYFRKRIQLGTIKDTIADVQSKMSYWQGVVYPNGNFSPAGDAKWQLEKEKVLG